MIEISLDRDEYDKIISAMTSLSQLRANNALNSAINKTAREASTRLKDAAKERYIVKASKLNKAESIRRASSFSDGAEIKYRASPESIANFKTRRRKFLGVAAQVLNNGYLKNLEIDGRKAFVTGVSWKSKTGSSGIFGFFSCTFPVFAAAFPTDAFVTILSSFRQLYFTGFTLRIK